MVETIASEERPVAHGPLRASMPLVYIYIHTSARGTRPAKVEHASSIYIHTSFTFTYLAYTFSLKAAYSKDQTRNFTYFHDCFLKLITQITFLTLTRFLNSRGGTFKFKWTFEESCQFHYKEACLHQKAYIQRHAILDGQLLRSPSAVRQAIRTAEHRQARHPQLSDTRLCVL